MTQPQSPLRLSVCIPTHQGRAAVLKEAIDSILLQLTPALREQVQVCVSDNASEDETQALMERYLSENPGLFVYLRHSVNRGLVGNLLALVGAAQGDYCWLFSSDDRMAQHGLSEVLAVLSQNPMLAGLTVDLSYYDRSMAQCIKEGMPARLLPNHPERRQVFTSPAQIYRECGSVMGSLSLQVFDRKLWLEAAEEVGEAKCVTFRYFLYLYLFGRMVKKRPAWLWLPEKLVQSRTDNDTLTQDLNRNALKYQTTVMEELHRIWGSLFHPASATCQALMRANFRSFWNGFALLSYKSRYVCGAADEGQALLVWTRCLYFLPAFWITVFPVLLTPSAVLRAVLPALKRTGWVSALRVWKRRLLPQGGNRLRDQETL
jgi:glycosyltransferase involved in cell wall biosynthesis